MSRVGKVPIPLPAGVTAEWREGRLCVTGPKGELERAFAPSMQIRIENGTVTVTRPSDRREDRALHGLTRSLVANMVTGVAEGYERVLELRGVGYRADLQGPKLVLQVGYSHPVEMVPPTGVEVGVQQSSATLENGYLSATITCRGIDREVLGDFVAAIRRIRPVEPYKGKGVRYRGETVRRKLGKAAKSGQTTGF